ncbi:hypothetical protein XELAEV_18032327mg [Xenopus laevis]|uniref:Uncharacterized protein n=1 Tax=Xenopus laevis TaxID=8355 RepID=A0A974HGY0_XENLA|nr:hypothetical protein XELAEV_18032327mg [Xenopus laevis]
MDGCGPNLRKHSLNILLLSSFNIMQKYCYVCFYSYKINVISKGLLMGRGAQDKHLPCHLLKLPALEN